MCVSLVNHRHLYCRVLKSHSQFVQPAYQECQQASIKCEKDRLHRQDMLLILPASISTTICQQRVQRQSHRDWAELERTRGLTLEIQPCYSPSMWGAVRLLPRAHSLSRLFVGRCHWRLPEGEASLPARQSFSTEHEEQRHQRHLPESTTWETETVIASWHLSFNWRRQQKGDKKRQFVSRQHGYTRQCSKLWNFDVLICRIIWGEEDTQLQSLKFCFAT